MEKGKDLNGNFEEVATYTLDGVAGNTVQGYEGPTAYKLNGEDKWCLLLDQYKGARYIPFVTNDISKGEFTKGTTFNFDATYCHGTVMPITQAEYDALACKKIWSISVKIRFTDTIINLGYIHIKIQRTADSKFPVRCIL